LKQDVEIVAFEGESSRKFFCSVFRDEKKFGNNVLDIELEFIKRKWKTRDIKNGKERKS
jgi:hypothetical protein